MLCREEHLLDPPTKNEHAPPNLVIRITILYDPPHETCTSKIPRVETESFTAKTTEVSKKTNLNLSISNKSFRIQQIIGFQSFKSR